MAADPGAVSSWRPAAPHGARHLPPGADPIEVSGQIVVLVQVDREWSNVEVPGDMRRMWETVRDIVGKLEPYCR